MAVRVTLKIFQTGKEQRIEMPMQVSFSRLVPAVIKKLELPITTDSGQAISYCFTYNGRRLKAEETPESAGLNHGDVLIIVPEYAIHAFSGDIQNDSNRSAVAAALPNLHQFEGAIREREMVSQVENVLEGTDISRRIAVSLMGQDGNLLRRAKLASNIAVARLIPEIISVLALPVTDSQGQTINYHLRHEGQLLPENSPLASTKVRSGDALFVIPYSIDSYLSAVRYQQRSAIVPQGGQQAHIDAPTGFRLRHILTQHKQPVSQIAWSPNGNMLASVSQDRTIQIWNMEEDTFLRAFSDYVADITSIAWTPDNSRLASLSRDEVIRVWNISTGQNLQSFTFTEMVDNEIRVGISSGSTAAVSGLAWSPDGKMLASSKDKSIWLWDMTSGQYLQTLSGPTSAINVLAWSPDGAMLASGTIDQGAQLWHSSTWQMQQVLTDHTGAVNSLSWFPDGTLLATSGDDYMVSIWNCVEKRQLRLLQGHNDMVVYMSFSSDGRLLASQSRDGVIRIWDTGSWQTAAVLTETSLPGRATSLAFHPHQSILATLHGDAIYIWDVESDAFPVTTSISHPEGQYVSAKVVLVGEAGVGKSKLSLVLRGNPYTAVDDSTHGCEVKVFSNQEIKRENAITEIHETFLWDFAGQPGYRLFHQLHLHEVTVALVVFDSRSETNPFAGVEYWNRALNHARQLKGSAAIPLKKFLVAARIDRGNVAVSSERIKYLLDRLGSDQYFETSAREGIGIKELSDAIQEAIDWDALPKVSSTDLFQSIKQFLQQEKEVKLYLATAGDLYRGFLRSSGAYTGTDELRKEFDACLRALESQDIIRRFGFGNYILLEPEMLYNYACALINAVKKEPDGFGSITENRVLEGDFAIDADKRMKDREKEKLLLIAMVRDLLDYEIVMREPMDDEQYLFFPSQATREHPAMVDLPGKEVILRFEGPVLNIYTTLVIRLAQAGLFNKVGQWKNVVTYKDKTREGGSYGLCLEQTDEGYGEIMLFFEKANKELRFYFEDFILSYLRRKVPPEHLHRERNYICRSTDPKTGTTCDTPVQGNVVQRLLKLGRKSVVCQICGCTVELQDGDEDLPVVIESIVPKMEQDADRQRGLATTISTLQGKREADDFDVFLCYNEDDLSAVKKIGSQLKECGVLPWLDIWEAPPGRDWQRLLEQQLSHIRSAAVFIGKSSIGPWESHILRRFINEFVDRDCPVIPVLLEDAETKPKIPTALKGMVEVDFRKTDPDPMERLMFGITGKHDFCR